MNPETKKLVKEELTGEKDPKQSLKQFEILNFMNGTRNLHEIVQAVSAECGETNMEHALRFIKDLEKTGFVTLQGSQAMEAS